MLKSSLFAHFGCLSCRASQISLKAMALGGKGQCHQCGHTGFVQLEGDVPVFPDRPSLGSTRTSSTESNREGRESSKGEVQDKVKRVLAFGKYPATALCRWLGSNGFTWEQGMVVNTKLGLALSEATVRIQVKAGGKGERGEPANLDATEVKTVKGMLKVK